jgi:DNA polymerase-3 subunit gamma/tau
MPAQSFSLAQKYRPQYFRDVIGQDIFVQTIKNALKTGKLGNAFLLTGIQGIGRTTLARLIAKTLSCARIKEDQESCGICPSCLSFQEDRHIDILEIDAASHTGIDDIRQILDSCHYSALLSTYKVFIIDEVHMLSKSAFNALLKTLEEPPPHVKFILATTEFNKVPITIVSRCQQLHLRRVPTVLIVAHLRKICAQENINISDEALALLARYGQGSVRDTLALLGRMELFSQSTISLETVQHVLGIPDKHEIQKLLTLILEQKADLVLEKIRNFYESGLEPQSILNELMAIVHEHINQYLNDGKKDSVMLLDRLWQVTQSALQEITQAPFPLLSLEISLLRMTYMASFPGPDAILAQIEHEDNHFFDDTDNDLSGQKLSKNSECMDKKKANSNETSNIVIKNFPTISELLGQLQKEKEFILYDNLKNSVSIKAWSIDEIQLQRVTDSLDCKQLSQHLSNFLIKWVGHCCVIKWENEVPVKEGKGILAASDTLQSDDQVWQHPLMQRMRNLFKGAILEEVRDV